MTVATRLLIPLTLMETFLWARHCAKGLYSSRPPCEVGSILIPILQIKRLRLNRVCKATQLVGWRQVRTQAV